MAEKRQRTKLKQKVNGDVGGDRTSNLYLASEVTQVKQLKKSSSKNRRRILQEVKEQPKRVPQKKGKVQADQIRQLIEVVRRLEEDYKQLQNQTEEFDRIINKVRKAVGNSGEPETVVQTQAVSVTSADEGQPSPSAEKSFLNVVEGILEVITTPGIGSLLTQLVSSLGK